MRAEPRRARAGLGAEKQKPEAAAAPLPERRGGRARVAAAVEAPPPAPPPPVVDPVAAAARRRGAALISELLGDFIGGGLGSVDDASQRALNPLLDSEGAPARRHRRRNPLLLEEGEEGEENV